MISNDKMVEIIQSITCALNPAKSLSFLKRCIENLVKLYTHLNKLDDLMILLTQLLLN